MGTTILLAGIVAKLDGLLGGTIAASAALLEKATNFPRHLCANIPASGERLVVTPIFDYPGVPPKVFHIVVLTRREDGCAWMERLSAYIEIDPEATVIDGSLRDEFGNLAWIKADEALCYMLREALACAVIVEVGEAA
jgi:8-oxo-dGTP pyrophosphatase MutT (NUDIX family)